MLREVGLALVSTLACGVGILAACSGGDDAAPAVPEAGTDASGGVTSSSSSSTSGYASTSSTSASSSSSGVYCDGPNNLCGNECIPLSSSPKHCGRCGNSCPSGKCSGGRCEVTPTTTIDAISNVFALEASKTGVVIGADNAVSICNTPSGCTKQNLIAIQTGVAPSALGVSSERVYFEMISGTTHYARSCPLSGCLAAGPAEHEQRANFGIGAFATSADTVVWTHDSASGNEVSGCTLLDTCQATTARATFDLETQRPTRLITRGAKSMVWVTGGTVAGAQNQLRYCPNTGSPCTTPAEIATDGAPIVALAYFQGKHFFMTEDPTPPYAFFAKLYVLDDETRAITRLATSVTINNGVSDLTVDASGIYWTNKGNQVLHCSGDCQTYEVLASDQVGVRFVAVNDAFVYWSLPTKILQVPK